MKKKRFSVEHIAGILNAGDLGTAISELCRQHGVSEQIYYRWKRLYGNMEPSEARELRQLREENAKLKRIVADLSLDKAMLQDVLQKNSEAGTEEADRAVWNSQHSVDTSLRTFRTSFERFRTNAAKVAMAPRSIVERFNVFGHVLFC